MSGEAFILLKGGRIGPNTAKQAEIRLANLLKILSIPVSAGRQKPFARPNGTGDGYFSVHDHRADASGAAIPGCDTQAL